MTVCPQEFPIAFCDSCRQLTDILYIDEISGLELCSDCYDDLNDDDDLFDDGD